jgi:hypothetical protein
LYLVPKWELRPSHEFRSHGVSVQYDSL